MHSTITPETDHLSQLLPPSVFLFTPAVSTAPGKQVHDICNYDSVLTLLSLTHACLNSIWFRFHEALLKAYLTGFYYVICT